MAKKNNPEDILSARTVKQKQESFFRRFWTSVTQKINIYRQIGLDAKYKKEFKRRVRELAASPNTDFVRFGLKVSENGENVSCLVQLPNEFIQADEYMIFEKLNDVTIHITSYLRENIGFRLYVSLPEFFHLEEPGQPDNVSMNFVAVWSFQPMISTEQKKKYLWWLYSSIGALVCGVTGLVLGLTL